MYSATVRREKGGILVQTAIKGVGKRVKEGGGGPKLVRRASRIPFLNAMLRAEVWGPFPDCVQIGQDATTNCPAGLTETGLFGPLEGRAARALVSSPGV